MSYTELPIVDSGSDYCECCKRRMCKWNSALQPRYRLVERPERNTMRLTSFAHKHLRYTMMISRVSTGVFIWPFAGA